MYQEFRQEMRQIMETISVAELDWMTMQLGYPRLILADGHIVGYEKEPTLREQE